MLKRLISIKFLLALTLPTLLIGCATNKTESIDQVINTSLASVEQPANVYLSEASKSSLPEKRDRNLLLAAHAYINDGNYSSASSILSSMLKNMVKVPTIQAEHIYLNARIDEKTQNAQAALTTLQYPPPLAITSLANGNISSV
ncbi:hypothetical protein L0B17_03790 [Shewanella sp. OMA3-2]|nr:hypothetical protein [Shewanella sp. OMA3-2]UJF22542.1 hypothetical protein L0B17_03790 [Shewanella sp. OMA3-2]